MNQSVVTISSPVTPTIVESRFKCNVCGKLFKRKGGLTRHLNIVKKYNITRSDLDILPENTIQQFKSILVYYIRKKLPKGYKKLGKQTVSVPATESQFYTVFKNHIHYYSARKGIYKCVFHGVLANQVLANILEMKEWGIKFYDQKQRTYVVLCDDNENVESGEENPISQAAKQCKSRCKRGQLIVEWKQQKNIDFNGNFTQAGHIYFHFFNSQAMIQ